MKKPLVIVKWWDAAVSSTWDRTVDRALVLCTSVGWLAGESKKAVTLVAQVNALDHVGSQMVIPRSTIKSMRRLRLGRNLKAA